MFLEHSSYLLSEKWEEHAELEAISDDDIDMKENEGDQFGGPIDEGCGAPA